MIQVKIIREFEFKSNFEEAINSVLNSLQLDNNEIVDIKLISEPNDPDTYDVAMIIYKSKGE